MLHTPLFHGVENPREMKAQWPVRKEMLSLFTDCLENVENWSLSRQQGSPF